MSSGIKKSHFTFMECIAVMVIIILLTTILLPVAVKCREIAKNIKCKSNIKALCTAITTYSNDYNGYGPIQTQNVVPPWTYMLQRGDYIPSVRVNKTYDTGVLLAVNQPLSAGNNSTGQYPVSYDNILACPSENINEMYNSWYCKEMNLTTAAQKKAVLWFNGTHYGIQRRICDSSNWHVPISALQRKVGQTVNGCLMLTSAQMPIIGDGINGSSSYYSTSGKSRVIWARHWGRTINLASYTETIYSYLGNAKINLGMTDGHVSSFTDLDIWKLNLWYVFGY